MIRKIGDAGGGTADQRKEAPNIVEVTDFADCFLLTHSRERINAVYRLSPCNRDVPMDSILRSPSWWPRMLSMEDNAGGEIDRI